MSENQKWVVTLAGDRPITEIEHELKQFHFSVEQVLHEVRCITGSADKETVTQLRSIPGIIDISPEPPQIDIGPPDAEIS